MTSPLDPVGFPAKPAGPGHNGPGRICHHWAAYRLTCAQYEKLRAFAGGLCGICKIPEAMTQRGFLIVDHFHSRCRASFIRGMLCDWCNQSVMECIDGLRVWGANRHWEAAAREYERNSWQQPSAVAIQEMAERREKLPKLEIERRRYLARRGEGQ